MSKEPKVIAKIKLPAPSFPLPPAGTEINEAWWDAYVGELSENDRQRFFDFGLMAFSKLARRNPEFIARLPEDVKEKLQSAVMRRFNEKRKSRKAAPKVFRPCPYCAIEFSARDLRIHKPHCPKTPRF